MKSKPISIEQQKKLCKLGLYLKNLRLADGLSQHEVCESLNLHFNTIQRIEAGKNSSMLTVLELAEFFELPVSELFSVLDD